MYINGTLSVQLKCNLTPARLWYKYIVQAKLVNSCQTCMGVCHDLYP